VTTLVGIVNSAVAWALLLNPRLRTAFAVADEIAVLGKGEIVHRSPPRVPPQRPLASRLGV
jgi:ABC-type branched-subunit amino acid transport system ATPase component